MAPKAPSRISQLAAIIYSNTEKLDALCAAESIPSPSFEVEIPPNAPAAFEQSRNEVLVATDELFDLMLGPRQLAECDPLQASFNHTSLIGIQAIVRYGIADHLKHDEEVTFSELAERCQLPANDLTRMLRQAMTRHIFKEPRKGYVAHTAASKCYIDEPLLKDWVYLALEEIWPAAVYMLDALDKWKGSGEPNHTVSLKRNFVKHETKVVLGIQHS
ncbi:hypothetical protein AOQ84DRAFT_296670 [Glonium stellatum]|uniref:O-methyltransferase dimerisation domain-containing protein n=1 Tax=Glonium stellatum TaxID=574774 RepID=A0A8E2EX92_9PEZI|nr:hypothetical protein AOQ84DRAFT_296670 [Glonium stellatum]